MKFFKRLVVIFIIAAFAIIADNINTEDSCGTGIITTFPFSLLVKIFETSGKNTAGNFNKEDLSKKVSVLGGVAFAQKKSGNIKVTFIELGSVNCVPCRMMQPVMKQVEEKYSDQVKVVFYDVWTEKDRPYAHKYGIRAIPTQVFLDRNGKEYFRHVGYYPFEEVEKVLKNGGVN
jgi:thioredoxin 1